MSNTPSDAELKELLPTVQLDRKQEPKVQVWLTQKDAIEYARAVLAKWGTPPAVAGEPFCYVSVNKQGDITRTMKRKDKWTNIPLYTTPQPTQAQAGAELAEADRRAGAAERELASCREDVVRLTRVRDRMKEQWGVDRTVSFDVVWDEALKLKQQAGAAPLTDEQINALDEDGVFLGNCKEIVRAIERAHGITGGQHGN